MLEKALGVFLSSPFGKPSRGKYALKSDLL